MIVVVAGLAALTVLGALTVALQARARRARGPGGRFAGTPGQGHGEAVAVFAGAFVALVAAAAPGMYFKDGGELASAALGLGVAHPTGFPVFCLVGKGFGLLPTGSSFFRMNLQSAAMLALAAALVYELAVVLGQATGRGALAVALVAPLGLLGSHAAWLHGTTTEVYALSAAGLAAALLAFTRASLARDARLLAAGWLLTGLGAGAHVTWPVYAAFAGLVASWAALRHRPGARLGVLGACALLAAGGALVVLYLPAAAARDPVNNWGDPSTPGALWAHLTGQRIRQSFSEIQEFHWAALRAHAGVTAGTLWEGCGPLLVLAGVGLAVVGSRAPAVALLLAGVLAGDVAFSAQINPMGVRDLQTLVPAAVVVSALAAATIVRGWALARREGSPALVAGVLATAALGLGMQWGASPAERAMTQVHSPREVAYALLDRAPVGATVLTTFDDLSAGLLGAQAIEDARPDVLVLVKQHLSDAAYVSRQARAHRSGPADDALIDEVRARPFEVGEGLVDALQRAVRRLSARGPVMIEPGEGAVDSELVRDLEPGFPAFGPGPAADRGAATERALASIEGFVPGADRWGREYLGAWARLLGTYLAMSGRPGDALPVLSRALAINPDDPRTLHNLAVLLADAGHPGDARVLLRHAVDMDATYLRGWRSLAKVAASVGLPDEAREAEERARELGN